MALLGLLVSAWCWPLSWVVSSSHDLNTVFSEQYPCHICGKAFSGAAVTGRYRLPVGLSVGDVGGKCRATCIA